MVSRWFALLCPSLEQVAGIVDNGALKVVVDWLPLLTIIVLFSFLIGVICRD